MQWMLFRLARLLGRFHWWVPVAFVLDMARPFDRLSDEMKGRFGYACMMSASDPRTRSIVARLIRRELGRSATNNLWLARLCWSLGAMKLAGLLYRRTERLPSSRADRQLAVCLGNLTRSIVDKQIYKSVAAWVDALPLPDPGSGQLVVVPVSSGYMEMFELWSAQLDKHLTAHRLLLALDAAATTTLQNSSNQSVLDLSSYFVFGEAQSAAGARSGSMEAFCKSNLWLLRVLVLRELALRGYTVYSLDLDAVVVGDLPGLMASLPACDIVAQIDYSIPMDVARKLGFVVCCGFMAIRPAPSVNEFFNRYAERTIREMDDQLALNHLVEEGGVEGDTITPTYKRFNALGLSWILPDKSIVSRDLHYGSTIRHFGQAGETMEELKQGMGLS